MKQPQLFQKPMLLLSLLLLTFSLAFSQVAEQWAKRYNSGKYDFASSLAVDGAGNVYVTGRSYDSLTGYDYATVKYNAAGNQLWVQRYNGPDNNEDGASVIAVDGAGNVYVAGTSNEYVSEYDPVDPDIVTVKYNAAGNQLWVQRYKDEYNFNRARASATDMAVDAAGNVYVTGSGINGEDLIYITLKYDGSGNQLWVKTYRASNGGDAYTTALALDGSGNVYVTGSSSPEYAMAENRYTTIKYNTNGTELWAQNYSNAAEDPAEAHGLAVDASGNVYVTGDIGTVKYSAAGEPLWIKEDAEGNSVAADGSGNVHITGNTGTFKYNAYGVQLWSVPGAGSELVVGPYDIVFVTGGIGIRRIEPDGAVLWTSANNGVALAVDASLNVYTTGTTYRNETGYDYVTIKYPESYYPTSVYSFTLINADTNEDIMELKDGAVLNLAALSTLNLNIRANTFATIGSILFTLSGAQTRNHTENIEPYALFADNNKGDYYAWTPTNGSYTLTATPYDASKANGIAGTTLTIHFTVTDTAVSSFILVNADTDQDIKTLQNGDAIDLAALPTRNLNIRAMVHPDTVGSVVFNLNNKVIVRENIAPYAIGGDIKGDYRPWILPTGNHTLTATPYALKNGRGTKGKKHTVSFAVVDMSATTRAVNAEKPIVDTQGAGESLKATPNPFAGQTTIFFSVPKSGYTTVQVFDMKGMMVARLYEAQADAGRTYNVRFNVKQLAAGAYLVRLITNNKVQSYKLVVLR
jgi:hypothetical protein